MKQFLVALFLGAVVIFGAGALCNKSNPSTPVSTSDISIENSAFNPPAISITKDTVVTWTNNDRTVHQIESDGNLSDLLSGEIAPGETFVFTFDASGTFNYHCKIHPEMKGKVTVN